MDTDINNQKHSPIALFVYNRPEHTSRVIEALQQNTLASQSVLYVFADGPKTDASQKQKEKIAETWKIVNNISGFLDVHLMFSETNNGCAKSIINGVSHVINKHGRVIVVEDDILTIPQFLKYMNDALDFYADDHRIWSVGGMNIDIKLPREYTHKHDLYLVHRGCSWGWGTWSDRWRDIDWAVCDAKQFFSSKRKMKRFDRGGEGMTQMLKDQLDGKIDAWDIVWDYHVFKHNGYGLRPIKSFTQNIGMDGSGTHYNNDNPSDPQAPLFNPEHDTIRFEKSLKPSREVQRLFYNYWSSEEKLFFHTRIKRMIKRILRNIGIMKCPTI